MKKATSKPCAIKDNEMRREYDFTGSVRGKHYKALQKGYTIKIHKPAGTTIVKHVKPADGAVVLAPAVLGYFPDSEAVNKMSTSLDVKFISNPHFQIAFPAVFAYFLIRQIRF